jgi:hypothetical protein
LEIPFDASFIIPLAVMNLRLGGTNLSWASYFFDQLAAVTPRYKSDTSGFIRALPD